MSSVIAADAEGERAHRESDGAHAIINTRLRELPRDMLSLRRWYGVLGEPEDVPNVA